MDAKSIINLGLGKLGSYSVNSIAPAVTPLEKKVAAGYPQWRDSEITKNRWVFARLYAVLTAGGASATMGTSDRPNGFAKPNDALRVLREKGAKWEQRGAYLYTYDSTLTIPYVARVVEAEFDPLFVDTLAARVAVEMCEGVTQSNLKKQDAQAQYTQTIRVARAANAITLGSDDSMTELDDDDDWLTARRGYGV